MEQKKFIPNQTKKIERVVVCDSTGNEFKRNNLLTNAKRGLGKAVQVGKDLSYTIGNDSEGYIEYFILNATINLDEK
jgi:hypothetical protein